MDFPFRNPTYEQVAAWYAKHAGKRRSKHMPFGEQEYAWWQLPRPGREGYMLNGHRVQKRGDAYVWWMHDTAIVEWRADGTRTIRHGNWLDSNMTRDALNTLTGVHTRVLPERQFSQRIGQRYRLRADDYSHGVPFTDELVIDRDGQPIFEEPPHDEVWVPDPVKLKEARALQRRLLGPARAMAAVVPHRAETPDDVLLGYPAALTLEFIAHWLQLAARNNEHARTMVDHALSLATLCSRLKVHAWQRVPSADVGQYLPRCPF